MMPTEPLSSLAAPPPYRPGAVAGHHLRWLLLVLLLVAMVSPSAAQAQDTTLAEQWGEVIARSPFAEPVHVASEQRRHSVSGSVHARVPHPFALLATELGAASAWCEILFLHPNVMACRHDNPAPGRDTRLTVHVGRLDETAVDQAERLDLTWRWTAFGEQYLAIRLEGDQGPYATRAFLLHLQAIPDDSNHSLIKLRYSLGFGTTTRLALQAYFAFAGRDRVGFSREEDNGEPRLVGGVRGMIERNVMRFYLALAVHLDTLNVPEAERLNARLEGYFAATDRYPRQLREQARADYLESKGGG